MWRLPVAVALWMTTLAWPAASGAAQLSFVQAGVGGLEADFDGDGFIDLAIGVAFEDVAGAADAGAVNVVYGSAGGLTAAGGQAFWQGTGGAAGTAEAGDQVGSALAGGDFNGDGFVDLAVGVPGEDIGAAQDAGAVSVLYGSTAGLSPAGGQAFWQGAGGAAGTAEPGDQFGFALAAGDLDGDGLVDLAVGVPFEDVEAAVDAGAVSVLYGSTAGLSPAGGQAFWQGTGGAAGTAETADVFGHALAAGDFDGNGRGDLAVGVAREDVGAALDAGAISVLYGSAGGLSPAGSQAFWQGTGGVAGAAEAGDELGWALAAGDFNGDTRADLAAGIPFENVGTSAAAGAVGVLSGSGGGLTAVGGQAFWQGTGGAAGTAERLDLFGLALGAGDFDNDGRLDLAVGAPLEDIGSTVDAGAVSALYGSAGGLTAAGSQGFWQGGGAAGAAEPGDLFGSSLVGGELSTGSATSASPSRVVATPVGASQDR